MGTGLGGSFCLDSCFSFCFGIEQGNGKKKKLCEKQKYAVSYSFGFASFSTEQSSHMDGMIEPLQTIPFTWIHFHTRTCSVLVRSLQYTLASRTVLHLSSCADNCAGTGNVVADVVVMILWRKGYRRSVYMKSEFRLLLCGCLAVVVVEYCNFARKFSEKLWPFSRWLFPYPCVAAGMHDQFYCCKIKTGSQPTHSIWSKLKKCLTKSNYR